MPIQKLQNDDGYLTFNINKFNFRKKVAAFDYDHTLVTPKKNTFSLNIDDWKWLRENVPNVLNNLYKKGFCIVIFTNQSKTFKVEQIKLCLSTLNIPIKVYIGIDKNKQKPNNFLWNHFELNKTVDFDKSFYCGDALGRQHDWSDSDKNFANNIQLKIISPEDMFPFSSKKISKFIPAKKSELVLMIGCPASGKTTYVTNEIPDDYEKISGDLLKTKQKKIKAVNNALEKGKKVVLDSTCRDKITRKIFHDIAYVFNVPVRAIYISTNFEECMYNNTNRESKVPKIALYTYRKNFEMPTLEEGFTEIITI